MQLSQQTDFALRIMVYLSTTTTHSADVSEIARFYDLSEQNIQEAVGILINAAFLQPVAEAVDSVRLTEDPVDITIGEVVRRIEPLDIVPCFDKSSPACTLEHRCGLTGVLEEAADALLLVLDSYTLGEIARGSSNQHFYNIPIVAR